MPNPESSSLNETLAYSGSGSDNAALNWASAGKPPLPRAVITGRNWARWSIDSGSLRLETIVKIAAGLEVDPGELVHGLSAP